MHECREFRERWTDVMMGQRPPANGVFADELEACAACRKFFAEVAEVQHALGEIDQSAPVPSGDWEGFESRLRTRLASEAAPAHSVLGHGAFPRSWLAAAAALLLAISTFAYLSLRPKPLQVASPQAQVQVQVATEVAQVELDPGTVEFLGQAEMYLRAFTKIESGDRLELEDARSRAELQLAGIRQRREAVADVPPAAAVLEDYEGVLRDIKNLDSAAGDDLVDIQGRIARKGLIAEMKAYQPRIVLMSSR